MKKGDIIFLSLIFILLLAVTSVSAADDTTADGNLTATDDMSVENVQDQDDLKLEETPADDSILQDDDECIYTEIKIDSQNILVGDDAEIGARLVDEDEGSIIDKEFNVSVARLTDDWNTIEIFSQAVRGNGTVTVPSTLLANGTYIINAKFLGEGIYDECENSAYFMVKNEKETPIFDIQSDGYYTSDEYLGFSFDLCDSNEENIASEVDVYVNGVYNCTLHQRGAEDCFDFYTEIGEKTEYEIRIVFKGDRAFNAQNGTITMQPRDVRTYMSIDAGTVIYGSDAEIEATLYDDDLEILNENFTVTVRENTADPDGLYLTYNVTGSGTITVPARLLKDGANYTVTATYAGDSTYTPCSETEEYMVIGFIATEFEILCQESVSLDSGEFNYTIGNTATIYYELLINEYENIEQYVDIYLNGELYKTVMTSDEQSEILIEGLKNGANTVSFVFSGAEGYGPANSTFTITSYEKRSKIQTDIPYAVIGNDLTLSLALTDGSDIIREDFTVTLYKGEYGEYETVLATYAIQNGTGTITIPSTILNARGSYSLLSHFDGNDVYSILHSYTNFFVHDEKQAPYISMVYYESEEYGNSTTMEFCVDSDEGSVPSLVDVYLNGEYYTTVNYTGGIYDLTVDGLRMGENKIKFSINETDMHKSATRTIEITRIMKDTEIYFDAYGETTSDMKNGIEFYFHVTDEWGWIVESGTADIYVNGQKYTTVDLARNPYVDSTDANVHYAYRAASPGEYNISIYYPGDGAGYMPSWSENKTFTLTYSEVNTQTTATLYNNEEKSEIRLGENLTFCVALANGNGQYFNGYSEIYVDSTKITSIYNFENFKFTPSQAGTYNITAKYEGDDLYQASGFSNSIIITVKEASKPATFTGNMPKEAIQGQTIEISYSVISNGEAIYEGDESNYVKIFINNDLIATTANLTGTVSFKLNRAGYNFVDIWAYSDDEKYDFSGRKYAHYQDACNAEANPDARIHTQLVISTDAKDLQIGDSIVIYNNLTATDELNYPDELLTLLNKTYSYDVSGNVPAPKLKYYLNGELIGESYINVYGKNSKIKFTLANVNQTGWYNFTAVLDDTENVFGCTSNSLSIYVEKIRTYFTNTDFDLNIAQTKDIRFILRNSKTTYNMHEPIDIYINGVKNATITSYDDIFTFKPDSVGITNITAVYKGSQTYAPSNKTIHVSVTRIYTYLNLATASTTPNAGEAVDVTVSLQANPIDFPQSVDIYINGVKNETVTMNGKTLTYQVIPVGETFTVYANYTGDASHAPYVSNTLTLKPIRYAPYIEISRDVANVPVGSAATITVTTPATFGLVDIYAGSAKVGTIDLGETNVYKFIPNREGTFIVYAQYVENGIYANSKSDSVAITSYRTNTYTYITSDRDVIELDSNANVTISFGPYSGEGSYPIDIYINDVKNATVNLNETDAYRFSANATGTYSIYAKFAGNVSHKGSTSNTIDIRVDRVSTSLVISSDKSAIEIGDSITVLYELSSKGETLIKPVSLDLNVRSVEISEAYVFTPQSTGTYEISASYAGDDYYNSTTSNIIRLEVNKKPTALVISSDVTEYEVGNAANVTVSLTSNGANLTGMVDIYVNGAKVDTIDLASSNVYTFNATTGGTYTIQANYTGIGNYSSTGSNTIRMTVSKKPTSLAISVNETEYDFGDTANITVSLMLGDANLTDMVDIYVNGVKAGSLNLGESNVYFFKPETSGNHKISAKYAGTGIYSECESNVLNLNFKSADIVPVAKDTIIVCKDMTTTAIDINVDGKKGAYFEIALKYSGDNPVIGKTVEVTLDKVTYTAKTDSNGIAKVQVNIKKAGTYKATVKFKGDEQLKASSATATIKVSKQKPKMTAKKHTFKVKKTKKVKVTLKTARGKALKGKTIILTIKKQKYSAKTKAKGIATFKIKLTKKGKYTGKARFKGDATYGAIAKKVKITIK